MKRYSRRRVSVQARIAAVHGVSLTSEDLRDLHYRRIFPISGLSCSHAKYYPRTSARNTDRWTLIFSTEVFRWPLLDLSSFLV